MGIRDFRFLNVLQKYDFEINNDTSCYVKEIYRKGKFTNPFSGRKLLRKVRVKFTISYLKIEIEQGDETRISIITKDEGVEVFEKKLRVSLGLRQ